jgi:hypothetical protein
LGEMIDATEGLLSTNGRKVEKVDDILEIEVVADYIDRGMPIMWSFLSTPIFQQSANQTTARRNGIEMEEDKDIDINAQHGGHICLIIGYNERAKEIAISDSWGPEFAKRWVPITEAIDLSYGQMNIIKW